MPVDFSGKDKSLRKKCWKCPRGPYSAKSKNIRTAFYAHVPPQNHLKTSESTFDAFSRARGRSWTRTPHAKHAAAHCLKRESLKNSMPSQEQGGEPWHTRLARSSRVWRSRPAHSW